MKKIISEDLSFDDTVKYGLVMEQGAGKVNKLEVVCQVKEIIVSQQ